MELVTPPHTIAEMLQKNATTGRVYGLDDPGHSFGQPTILANNYNDILRLIQLSYSDYHDGWDLVLNTTRFDLDHWDINRNVIEDNPDSFITATKGNLFVIVFHGTKSEAEWEVNLNSKLTAWSIPSLDISVNVHQGFLDHYTNRFRSHVIAVVSDAFKTSKSDCPLEHILVTGHSLGGALASFCALDLKGIYSATNLVKAFLLSPPVVVGDKQNREIFHNIIGKNNIIRHHDFSDPVCRTPTVEPNAFKLMSLKCMNDLALGHLSVVGTGAAATNIYSLCSMQVLDHVFGLLSKDPIDTRLSITSKRALAKVHFGNDIKGNEVFSFDSNVVGKLDLQDVEPDYDMMGWFVGTLVDPNPELIKGILKMYIRSAYTRP